MEKETVVFGGGCFWCTEAVIKMLRGIISVTPGYAGGTKENPTYKEVTTGKTGHAEVVRIEFNSEEIGFSDLLTVFFATHDPTTLNKQGSDTGPQYRSVIFYTTPKQKSESENFIRKLQNETSGGDPIVTAVEPLDTFYAAEDYHKNYYEKNKDKNPYCQIVINPKLEKVQKRFAKLLKSKFIQK